MASKAIPESSDDWRIDSDLRTLAEAEAIKKDSKRYKAALSRAQEKIAELKEVQLDGLEEAAEKE